MIVYQATKAQFLQHAQGSDIDEIVGAAFLQKLGRTVGKSEIKSWKASLDSMAKVLTDDGIPATAGVAIEYNIPQTGKRVDFILTGRSADRSPNVIIVELKQWESATISEKDGIVSTFVGGSRREVSHPSYQAWSYAALLEGFNEAVYDGNFGLKPCAYLHNYIPDEVIGHSHYDTYLERAPVFLKGERERQKLRDFIKRNVRYGDDIDLLYKIENGRIRPSKMLADSLVKMLKGQPEFVLIDDQKVVFEMARALARRADAGKKKVLIVEGGPGTGKSVVAINLLAALTKEGQVCRYVSKNAAPRSVYQSKLTGHFKATYITNLFSGSGAFVECETDAFDTLIVDEAHRLNEKSGLYENLGDNQIREIIDAAKCTVFFIDEDQRVTLKDIGGKAAIAAFAQAAGAELVEVELASQFRCNGSDGYLAWLDHTLGVRDTANPLLEAGAFDFRVVDSPAELHWLIAEKNKVNNKARVVAGYCWDWKSKNDPQAFDIEFPAFGYRKRWNLTSDGSLWIVAPESVDEVGCIHTCQGLEVDYVGVIVGDDFVVRNDAVVCQPDKRSKSDRSIRGWKTLMKAQPEQASERLDLIIKNTYRTLMTRGMKGCYVYCTDAETARYFRSRLQSASEASTQAVLAANDAVLRADANVLPFKRVAGKALKPYKNAVPLIDLKLAAGAFSDFQAFDQQDLDWVALPDLYRPQPGLFVAQVVGESMNRRIPNGSWCLFRMNPQGTRAGKVVVAQHRAIDDPELGGAFTVKVYQSEKRHGENGEWRHARVELHPDSTDPKFVPLVFGPESADGVVIVAEFIAVLDT